MYNIENSTVNMSVRSWEWDRFDDEYEEDYEEEEEEDED